MPHKLLRIIFFVFLLSYGAVLTSNAQNISTVDLAQFCAVKGLHYRLDPLTQIAEVSTASSRLKFHVGSDYALVDDRLVRLNAKTRLERGAVLAGDSAKTYLDSLVQREPVSHTIHKVVLDAGHGGEDMGAISPWGLKEKNVVLDVTRRVKELLEARGLEVVMTRDSDVFIPLAGRAAIANRTEADFFVSIHANASPSRSLDGFEIYYLSEATDDAALALERAENSTLRFDPVSKRSLSKDAQRIFWDLRESENRKESLKIAERMMDIVAGSLKTGARRIRTANFYVLKWTECPAVLVETGYLTNRQDEKLLRSPIYKKELAQAIVAGIWKYKEE